MIVLNGLYFHTEVLQGLAFFSVEVLDEDLIGVAVPARGILGLKHLHF